MNKFNLFFIFNIMIALPSFCFADTCIDTDGDGWGWDGVKSCIASSPTPGDCIDTDGDGWGWDGVKSCIASSPTPGDCIDTDGDGWGWDGVKSCLIDPDDSLMHSATCPESALIYPGGGYTIGVYEKTGYPNVFVDQFGFYRNDASNYDGDLTTRQVRCTTQSQNWLKNVIFQTENNNWWIRANNFAKNAESLIQNGERDLAEENLELEKTIINFFDLEDLHSDIGVGAFLDNAVGGYELEVLWMIEDEEFVQEMQDRYLEIIEEPYN